MSPRRIALHLFVLVAGLFTALAFVPSPSYAQDGSLSTSTSKDQDDFGGSQTDSSAPTDSSTSTDSGTQSDSTPLGGFDVRNTGSGAGERIVSFDSDATVGADGVLTVRETIVINSQGSTFQHGIKRNFPTTYVDRMGNRTRVGFDVQSITRDGRVEPYSQYGISNGVELKIGSADVLLNDGLHTYVIAYTTTRQIGFFEQFDELYWNATGNGWPFAIDRATATIHLPPGANVVRTSFYTGGQGETRRNANEERVGSTVRFATTQPLGPYEGLTIAVAFNKGIVAPPSSAQEAGDFLRDNAATGAALFGLAILALYFGYTWWRFGKDPQRGTFVPLFEPPKNFSPAATRFVHRMGYDRKAFAAALIGMAVKGYLKVSEEGRTYTLTRTGRSEQDTGLGTGERALAQKLFAGGDTIELKNANHTTVQSAITALQSALRNEDEGVYFVTNRGWFWGGVAILVLSAVATAFASQDGAKTLPVLMPVGVWSVALAFLVHRAWLKWQGISGPGIRFFNIAGAVFSSVAALFVFGFFGVLVLSFGQGEVGLPYVAMVALAIQGVLAFVFYRLLKAPTVAGQKIRDQIEGFKIFLETAEKDRLEMLHPPKVTPEVFEKYLPYAIALDCENQWSKKFEAEAALAGVDTTRTYSPGWYSGSSFSRLGTTGFVSAVGTAVASAAASAAVAPGSHSGSGGGGFSGGGGGGGGGGGW